MQQKFFHQIFFIEFSQYIKALIINGFAMICQKICAKIALKNIFL